MPQFVKVAQFSDLQPGECTVVEANGNQIALFNVEGQFYATDNVCKHRGGPLGEGFLEENTVICPWHSWQYDVRTGQCMTVPDESVKTYEVKVEGEDISVVVE